MGKSIITDDNEQTPHSTASLARLPVLRGFLYANSERKIS